MFANCSELTVTLTSAVAPAPLSGASFAVTGGVISSQSTVAAQSGDFVLVSDTADSGNLKKVDIAAFINVTATNLGIANLGANTLQISSSTGTNATVPAATGTTAGLLTAADKTALDGKLDSVQQGTNVTIDVTDPNNPIINVPSFIGGSTGANDNRLLRSDGAGGSTLQTSPVTLSDTGVMSGVSTLNVTTSASIPLLSSSVGVQGEVSANSGTGKEFGLAKEAFINASTGLETGGVISLGSSNSEVSVTAGTGRIVDLSGDTYTEVTWSQVTNAALSSADGSIYLYVDNLGAVQQTTTKPTAAFRRANIYLGRLSVTGGQIQSVRNEPVIVEQVASQVMDLSSALKVFNVEGNDITANGANLSLSRSAGELYDYSDTVALSSDALVSFRRYTQNGTASTSVAVLDPSNYDNAGTVTAIAGANEQATNVRVYLFTSGNIAVCYGQTVYPTLEDAIVGLNTEVFVEPDIVKEALLVKVITITKGATSLQSPTDAVFTKVSRFGEIGQVSVSGSTGGGTSNLQEAYDATVGGEILTDATRGALDLRRGSAADSDEVLTVKSNDGTTNFSVTGEGNVTAGTINGIDLSTALNSKQDTSQKGQANGYAGLDANSTVPAAQLPSSVKNVEQYANLAAFPATGSNTTLYIAQDTNFTYRWDGSAYADLKVYIPELNTLGSTAVVEGMVASGTLGGTTVDITAGVVDFYDNTDPDNPVLTRVNYAGDTGIAITNIATSPVTYIGINNTGTIVQQSSLFTPSQRRNIATVAVVVHPASVIANVQEGRIPPSDQLANQMADLVLALGPINLSGNVITPNGANLSIDKTAGSLFAYGLNRANDPTDPSTVTLSSLTAPVFTYTWKDGSGGWNTAVTNVLNPTASDDGTGGATEPSNVVNNNNWSVQRVYITAGNVVAIHYGQEEYGTSIQAIERFQAEDFETNPSLQGALFRGYIILRGGAADLTQESDAIFLEASKFGAVGGGGAGSSSTLQAAYDLSNVPQIITDLTLGPVSVRAGNGDDTLPILQGQNNAGVTTFRLNGDGSVTADLRPASGSYASSGAQFFTPAANGLFLAGQTGTSTDFLFTNGLGQTVFTNPTGTRDVIFSGDASLRSSGPVLTLGSSSGNDPRVDFLDQGAETIAASLFYDQSSDSVKLMRTVTGTATDGISIKANGIFNIGTVPTYSDDTAAGVGGLVAGDIYKTATGELRIKL